jgi:hypothetical protein
MLSIFPATAGQAAAPVLGAPVMTVVAEPTELATDEDKVEAARVLGINAGVDLLVLNDQDFTLAIWRLAKAGSAVKAEALRVYDDEDAGAAYAFIKTGIFAAAADDAQAEILAEQAKARRRSVAVTVGLDPRDTVLIEKSDRDFIFSVFQRAKAGSHVWTAAQTAIADDTDETDWDEFLNTGAQAAAEQDVKDAIDVANEAEKARLLAEQLATAKRSLLQLLLLPVTEELVAAPNRQYVLHVKNNAKGAEVQLAAQVALNAPDDDLVKALSDFIFTGGAAANQRDEDAAEIKERDGYRTRVIPIRDAAKHDGFQPQLVAAAEKALTENTVLALQYFLLKGQDEARAKDRQLDFTSGLEAGQPRMNWDDAVESNGGSVGVGGIVAGLTGSELGMRAMSPHTGTNAMLYSGKDTSATKSHAYNKAFSLTNATVKPSTTLSYWIYPQGPGTYGIVGTNSTCVSVDLIFSDNSTLRDSGVKDQNGVNTHPGSYCGRLNLNAWNEVKVPVGTVASGKKVARVSVGYDQNAGTGDYRGFIDDIKLTDLDTAPKFRSSAETGDPGLTWTNTIDTGESPHGGVLNVGGIWSSVPGPELFRSETSSAARTGKNFLVFSGKDNSATNSYAYTKAYSLGETYVTPSTQLSYWIYPQSTRSFSGVAGNNSMCVGVDLLLQDQIDGTLTALRSTSAKDQKGNSAHPGGRCGKLTLDTWNFVSINLGGVANGKRITQLMVAYDQKVGTGGYRGHVDDIRITQ